MANFKFENVIYIGYSNMSEIVRPIFLDKIKTNYVVTSDGRIFRKISIDKYREVKACNSKGYSVVLIYHNGTRSMHKVHRLVAKAFIEIPQHYIDDGYTADTLTVNHINGESKHFNSVVNLEWATPKEQAIHANSTGLCHPKHGENHPWSKLTKEDVISIAEMIQNNEYTLVDIAKKFNVSRKTIALIYQKKRWYREVKKYDFSNFNKTRKVDSVSLCNAIHALTTSTLSVKEISDRYNISYSYLSHLNKSDKVNITFNNALEKVQRLGKTSELEFVCE